MTSPVLTPAAPTESTSANDMPAPKHKTKGEQIYDTALYGGVGFGLNFVLSVITGHFFLKGKGQQFFNSTQKAMEDGLTNVVQPKVAKLLSKESMRIMTLGLGGHLVMVPVKMLEDRKKRLVYWINSRFFPEEYGDNQSRSLKQLSDEELPPLVEEPSQMSWGQTIMRRAAIYVGVVAALSPFGKLNSMVEDKLHQGLKEGLKSTAQATQSKRLMGLKDSKLVREYVELTASDLYISAISAFLVRMTNGAHGLFKGQHKKRETAAANNDTPAISHVNLSNETGFVRHTAGLQPASSYQQMLDAQNAGEYASRPTL